ncbi:MAG: hypothetical protein F4234_00395 [Gammaproteobacteria bacterium]|nr:hypothetical protein [Gammaproteobacteria bacterium]MXY90608.1 hypothetical protein [Gammaproteobacteria bacterium]MYE98652.1 hypothetical protein [Gammaproteobacteria bacterium]MYG95506.1 hypothetical protein [Gammaproteobacteria bacterium]
MTRKSFVLMSLAMFCAGAAAQDYEIPYTEWGVPDFQGVWKHATVMPFERPEALGEQRTYSEEDVLELERRVQQQFDADNEPLDPDRPAPVVAESLPPIGNYDLFWRDDAQFLPTIGGEFRTSAIIEPANGRMPEVRQEARERMLAARGGRQGRNNDGPEGRSLGERCLVAFGNLSGPVMSPVIYNSHLQFVQSPGYITIVAEMVHDARIIPIGGERNPAAAAQRKWMGDAIGRWEGDTLVVETQYFNDWHSLRGLPVDNITITETFRRESDFKLIYGFRVNDPSVFAGEFYGEYPLSRIDEPIYEYACHEGNYGMFGILQGARRLEVMSEFESGDESEQ